MAEEPAFVVWSDGRRWFDYFCEGSPGPLPRRR